MRKVESQNAQLTEERPEKVGDKEETKNKCNNQKTVTNIDINSTISVITLNVNYLNIKM